MRRERMKKNDGENYNKKKKETTFFNTHSFHSPTRKRAPKELL